MVSDWDSVREMITHGIAADRAQATLLAVKAGTDMDIKALALIGPLADNADDLIGSWSAKGEATEFVLNR